MSAYNMNSALGLDYYQVLGVPRDATTEEIQQAFSRLSQAPEEAESAGIPDGIQVVHMIREEAYKTLTADAGEREAYDGDLRRSFIWSFLQARGFQVKTTTRLGEIIEFLEEEDFIGFMAGEGLPVKGWQLSLDGRYYFELGSGREERKAAESRSLVIETRPVPVMEPLYPVAESRPIITEGTISYSNELPTRVELPVMEAEAPRPHPSSNSIPSSGFSSIWSRMPRVWDVLHHILFYLLLACLLFRIPNEEVRTESSHRDDARMNHYEVLGVPATASVEDIRRAYHAAALQFHPDKVHAGANGSNAKAGVDDDEEEVNETMCRINEAYSTLSTDARCLYDHETLHGGSRQYAECMEAFGFAEAERLMEQRVEMEREAREREQKKLRQMVREGGTTNSTELSLVVHPVHRAVDSAKFSLSKSLRAAEMAVSEYVVPVAHVVSRRLRIAGNRLYLICYNHESTRLVVFFLGQLIGIDICGAI
ncbi:hypothetical protein PFICI_01929 [Pestalotiopsis fici W106-1]|uniref:J domain-containing protein n=1 Tax=Pestalotiopsis fici (strain W106-1 / CGMCC3.15140) TaxID=1229662 RepID=W3XS95_PESFW|nr:uncharacterized protein PFICI_01929 [Pestalotiopsis fici W106-1]ETS88101.1 hypothetical protein PFICI_01929 [Pestalotiopsis fici W106-1]